MVDVRKIIEQKKAVIGTDRVIKGLQRQTLREVLLSSNVADSVRKMVLHHAKLAGVAVTELKENSEELAVLCKKPFHIAMIGVM